MDNKKRILVIGGMNMDILGSTGESFRLRDSLPGRVQMVPGGVGRNIAEQLALLGVSVSFLTVLGNDAHAKALEESCERLGIGISLSLRVACPSPVYLAIHDNSGDMVSAINDMRAMNFLKPEYIKKTLQENDGFDACVLDANLSEDCLVAAAENVRAPLVADPVSAAKCVRLLPILSKLQALKPNLVEAQALTGREKPEDAVRSLLLSGVLQVFISLGNKGLYYDDGTTSGYLRASEVSHVSLTGAGDAMTAGIAFSLASGLTVLETAKTGLSSSEYYLKRQISEE